MCGIAGISIAEGAKLDVELVVLALLAGLAERGEDSAGYAFHGADGQIAVRKRTGPVEPMLAETMVPATTRAAMVHLRDHTKGSPAVDANNHPIRHGGVVGVHNGRIQNDEQLFARHGAQRAASGMTVDSEAIFMLLDRVSPVEAALGQLVGSYTCAWLHDTQPEALRVARGRGRPLFLGHGGGLCVFASTVRALRFVAEVTGLALVEERIDCGTLLELRDGMVAERSRFSVRRFAEERAWVYDHAAPNAVRARAWVAAEAQRRSLLGAAHASGTTVV